MGDTANFLTGFRKEVCAQSNVQLPDKLYITNLHPPVQTFSCILATSPGAFARMISPRRARSSTPFWGRCLINTRYS